jgi:YcaO-like protein with predicted kinase domain
VSTPVAAPSKTRYAGTERSVPPERTLERVTPLLPALGITRVAQVTGLDRIGIPTWIACRPNSRSLSTSQGKGLTDGAARVSAIMECLELHHAERPLVPLLLASSVELWDSGRTTVEAGSLPGTTTGRYHPHRPLLWTEGTDLVTGGRVWLPFEVVHTSALVPAPTGSGCFQSTSNGLASGNTMAEATVHGLCEVIERDAVAVWQQLPDEVRAATLMDLDTVDDADCRSVLDRYAAAGIAVTVVDVTSDIGVPAFLCEITDSSEDGGEIRYSGMGCHLTPGIALLRALLEAAQSRLTYIAGSRDVLLRQDYRMVQRAGGGLLGPSVRPTREFASAAARTLSFEEDIDRLIERLGAAGLRSVIAVDLSSPNIGIPVVRVVVPGLEGPDDDPTYLPGARARAVRLGGG